MEAVFFWLLALCSVAGGLLLVFHKNPIHSALSLIGTLFCTAGLFIMLNATFIGILQIMVYAGAIMVLFLFVIMMLNLTREELGLRRHALTKLLGSLFIVAFFVKYVMVLIDLPTKQSQTAASFGSVENIAMQVYTMFPIAVEGLSVLLLAAIVGAVVLAKRKI